MKIIPFNRFFLISALVTLLVTACDKVNLHDYFGNGHSYFKQTKDYPADLVIAWMKVHLDLNRTSPVPLRLNGYRFFPYCGIALYESVVAGMPGFRSLSGQLTDLPVIPAIKPGVTYHWPTCANAALAYMNRNLFGSTASAANLASIDSLEAVLNGQYQAEISDEEFQRSVEFGQAVAKIIYDWSVTDGSAVMIDPNYVLPVGPGLWVPTPPALALPVGPYWGKNRLFVQGSLNNSYPPPPNSYSTDPNSDYFKMEKEVYDISQTLTPEQTATGLYWRDNPGYGNAHFSSVMMQIIQQVHPSLDMAALAYAKTGIAIGDATIGCWEIKYQYTTERPITYIRTVLGHPDWNALFATPPHPDYLSAHSAVTGAMTEILTGLLGNHFHFEDHSYDYLGMTARKYNSFEDLNEEIINARVYAGIHTRDAAVKGIIEGKKIAENIDHLLRFRK